jgi:hypothetical protein
MSRGDHLTRSHQSRVGARPRPGKVGVKGMPKRQILAEAPQPDPDEELSTDPDGNMTIDGETLDAATLRLQIARANAQETDAERKTLDLAVQRKLYISKDEAVDLSQEVAIEIVGILDLLPEHMRDRMDPGATYTRDEVCYLLDEVIRDDRTRLADGL